MTSVAQLYSPHKSVFYTTANQTHDPADTQPHSPSADTDSDDKTFTYVKNGGKLYCQGHSKLIADLD